MGDTLVLTPRTNWPRGASKPPNLYWLKRGACPKRGGLRHDPLALGLVRLSPSVNRFGKRLELSFDAPGTYTYSTDYASSCASGRVVVRVRGRAFDCPRPIPARPGERPPRKAGECAGVWAGMLGQQAVQLCSGLARRVIEGRRAGARSLLGLYFLRWPTLPQLAAVQCP